MSKYFHLKPIELTPGLCTMKDKQGVQVTVKIL